MNLQNKLIKTRIFKTVFPNTTNHYDTLFEEQLFYDGRSSFYYCHRFTRKDASVSSDKLILPNYPAGTIIELRHNIVLNTSRRES
jgi:hypothetical protein